MLAFCCGFGKAAAQDPHTGFYEKEEEGAMFTFPCSL